MAGKSIDWISSTTPHTQKAKSLFVIYRSVTQSSLFRHVFTGSEVTEPLIVQSDVSTSYFNGGLSTPINTWLAEKVRRLRTTHRDWLDSSTVMARPCPSVPRHGFVESRPIKTLACLRNVVQETRKADPKGEVILMPFIAKAKYSSVITEAGVTIGPSNDGATAGHDATFLPCPTNLLSFVQRLPLIPATNGHGDRTYVESYKYLGLQHKDRGAYIEAVEKHCVQIRYGPKVNNSTGIWSAKQQMYVSEVYTPKTTDVGRLPFAELEKQINDLASRNRGFGGCVLYLPDATLAAHIAVQAIASGISVVTGDAKPPVEGEKYNFGDSGRTLIKLDTNEYKLIHNAFVHSSMLPFKVSKVKAPLAWAIAVIQGLAPAPNTLLKFKCIAAAAGIIIRFGIAACLGEHRRYFGSGPGRFVDGHNPALRIGKSLVYSGGQCEDLSNFSRSTYQTSGLSYNISDPNKVLPILGKLSLMAFMFDNERWEVGFGGKKWAECTQRLITLYQLTLELINSESVEALNKRTNKVILAANAFISTCHNSGKCLTKFIGSDILADISTYPALFLVDRLSLDVANNNFKLDGEHDELA